jgi:branched-chain amino acid transport system permease protein
MSKAVKSKAVKLWLLAVLAILLIVLPWLVNPYTVQILILTITYSMLGLAFGFSLKVGLPRFDIAAWWGVGGYTTALLMLKAHMNFWPTVIIGGIVAMVLGFFIFIIAVPRGMMVFLMFGMVVAMAIQQIFGSVKFFGGWSGTGLVPRPTIFAHTIAGKPELYYLGLFFLVVNLLVYYLLYNSKIGRAWNAIGSSLRLAGSTGIDVVRYRMANVLVGNFFLAVAGSYYIAFTLSAVPTSFSFSASIFVMMYIVVGGIAHILSGPLLGALIITFIPEYLRVAKEYEPIITAVITILIIIFLPTGILGWIDQKARPWLAHLGKGRKKEQGVPA